MNYWAQQDLDHALQVLRTFYEVYHSHMLTRGYFHGTVRAETLYFSKRTGKYTLLHWGRSILRTDRDLRLTARRMLDQYRSADFVHHYHAM